MPESKVHLADFQSFKCTKACVCCKRPWFIKVEPEVKPGIRASKLYASLEKKGYTPLVVVDDGRVNTGRAPNGHCVFLDANGLCGLHTELGARHKPIGCQMYPYRATRTPSGFFVSLSFTCPSVVAGVENDIEENRADLSDILEKWPQAAAKSFSSVHLTNSHDIAWEDYLSYVEPWLLSNYEIEQPIRSLLAMAANISAFSSKKCGWPPPAGSPIDEDFLEEIMASYLVAIIPLIESLKDKLDVGSYIDKLNAGEQIFSNHLQAPAPRLDPKRAMSPWALGRFHCYFKNQVIGKALLDPSIATRLLSLAIGCAVVAHYAEGARQALKESELSVDSLTQAFYIMGTGDLSHSRTFLNFYEDFENTLPKLMAF